MGTLRSCFAFWSFVAILIGKKHVKEVLLSHLWRLLFLFLFDSWGFPHHPFFEVSGLHFWWIANFFCAIGYFFYSQENLSLGVFGFSMNFEVEFLRLHCCPNGIASWLLPPADAFSSQPKLCISSCNLHRSGLSEQCGVREGDQLPLAWTFWPLATIGSAGYATGFFLRPRGLGWAGGPPPK